jgi:hypothetical protein
MHLPLSTLKEAAGELRQAKELVSSVRDTYLACLDTSGARMLNDIAHLLDDEIAALGKRIRDAGRLLEKQC